MQQPPEAPPPNETVVLPSLEELQGKTDSELLLLFNPTDAGLSPYYGDNLTDEETHNEYVRRFFCMVGRDRDPQCFAINMMGFGSFSFQSPQEFNTYREMTQAGREQGSIAVIVNRAIVQKLCFECHHLFGIEPMYCTSARFYNDKILEPDIQYRGAKYDSKTQEERQKTSPGSFPKTYQKRCNFGINKHCHVLFCKKCDAVGRFHPIATVQLVVDCSPERIALAEKILADQEETGETIDELSPVEPPVKKTRSLPHPWFTHYIKILAMIPHHCNCELYLFEDNYETPQLETLRSHRNRRAGFVDVPMPTTFARAFSNSMEPYLKILKSRKPRKTFFADHLTKEQQLMIKNDIKDVDPHTWNKKWSENVIRNQEGLSAHNVENRILRTGTQTALGHDLINNGYEDNWVNDDRFYHLLPSHHSDIGGKEMDGGLFFRTLSLLHFRLLCQMDLIDDACPFKFDIHQFRDSLLDMATEPYFHIPTLLYIQRIGENAAYQLEEVYFKYNENHHLRIREPILIDGGKACKVFGPKAAHQAWHTDGCTGTDIISHEMFCEENLTPCLTFMLPLTDAGRYIYVGHPDCTKHLTRNNGILFRGDMGHGGLTVMDAESQPALHFMYDSKHIKRHKNAVGLDETHSAEWFCHEAHWPSMDGGKFWCYVDVFLHKTCRLLEHCKTRGQSFMWARHGIEPSADNPQPDPSGQDVDDLGYPNSDEYIANNSARKRMTDRVYRHLKHFGVTFPDRGDPELDYLAPPDRRMKEDEFDWTGS